MPYFILHQQSEAMERPANEPCRSLTEFHSTRYDTIIREALQAGTPTTSGNLILNKKLEVYGEQWLHGSVAPYSPANKGLVEYLVNDEESAWATIAPKVVDVGIGWLLA